MLSPFQNLLTNFNYQREVNTVLMQTIYQKIIELESLPGCSKHQRIVDGVINAINDKIVRNGEILPSVNALIKELGFARETVAKAYRDLVNKGIIESKNRLGYYVSNVDTDQSIKVALMMCSIDSYQERLYNSFRNTLGENAHLDVFFHHNNIEVCETMLSHVNGKYGMYVICPVTHPKIIKLLEAIPKNKFLMIDRFEPLENEFNYITQEFEQASYKIFENLYKAIIEFDEIIFFCKNASPIEQEIVSSFNKFIKNYKVKGKVVNTYIPGSVKKGKVYFSINNAELWTILKDVKNKKLKLGRDVGILSMNDEPIKELILGGITTFSTDFSSIGKLAAQHVLTHTKVQKVIPTILYRRKSL